MKPAILALFALMAAPFVPAQEKADPKAPQAVAESKVYRVTVILRVKGSNIPGKFVSYLDDTNGNLVMPLFQKDLPRWVAEVVYEAAVPGKQSRFYLQISDVSHLELRSAEGAPLGAHPVEILDVSLPLEIGPEIPVFKSPTLSIAIQFDQGS